MPPFQPASSFWCQNAMKGKDQNGKRQDPQRLKTRSHRRSPKKNAWFGEGKKNRGKDAVEFDARRFRSYPNWLSISARLSTKPGYRLIFLKKMPFASAWRLRMNSGCCFKRSNTHHRYFPTFSMKDWFGFFLQGLLSNDCDPIPSYPTHPLSAQFPIIPSAYLETLWYDSPQSQNQHPALQLIFPSPKIPGKHHRLFAKKRCMEET